MITYSTEFPINEKNSVEDVVRLACTWITGSKHSKIPKESLDTVPESSELVWSTEDETVRVACTNSAEFKMGGVRYTRVENGNLDWTTSIVTYKDANQHLLSLQISCEYLRTAAKLPAPKKPYFIRQVFSKLGGGSDGLIPVADRPFHFNNGEEDAVAALMQGTANNRLPIVYLSARYDGTYAVDPQRITNWVSGTAHVIVEPSRAFSLNLKKLVASKNAFGGSIGVYWPDSTSRSMYFLEEHDVQQERALEYKIAQDIRVALANRRQDSKCSWLSLTEAVARRNYESLKEQGSTQISDYIDAFDSDQKAKEQRLLEAEQEIARLKAELAKYGNRTGTGAILRLGTEQDLYENEITQIVLAALKDAKRNSLAGGRKDHVLTDLLTANETIDSNERLMEAIKSVFNSYRTMDAKTKSALAQLGFDVTADGKHFKAVYQGDGRYTFAIPSSSSDVRAGKNLASDINKRIF